MSGKRLAHFWRTWIWDWKVARLYFIPAILYTVLLIGVIIGAWAARCR